MKCDEIRNLRADYTNRDGSVCQDQGMSIKQNTKYDVVLTQEQAS